MSPDFKAPLLQKKAMDALLETMQTDDYDALGGHGTPGGGPGLEPEQKGTEFSKTNDIVIPAKDLHPPDSPADATFFKEGDPDKEAAGIPEMEMQEHEFFKESEPEFEMSASGVRRLAGSDTHSPEWQSIQNVVTKFGYRWLGVVTDGTELWGNKADRITYDPARRHWTHTENGKLVSEGVVEELADKIESDSGFKRSSKNARAMNIATILRAPKFASKNEPDPGDGKYDFQHETHVRKEAHDWSQYAEESDNTDNIKPFDPAGNYLCGTCDMRMGEKECQRVEGDINMESGSCRLFHLGEPENGHQMVKPFTKEEAKYGEHEGGFGCHRCEYGGAAAAKDPEGRDSWCSFWGMHVLQNACCAEWDQDAAKDKEESKTAAAKPKCPHCGSDDYGLMPSDFETAKCNGCGKNWDHGIVDGINNPYSKSAGEKLQVGGKGVDRNGGYEVTAIKGNEITYRYEDGSTQKGDLAIKQRIHDGIQAEQSRANAPKKIPGYLQEDEILWTPEMAQFLGYLAGPGRARIFAEAPPKYEEAVINKYHDLTGQILEEGPGKFNIAPETKWSPELAVMFRSTDEMPDEIARMVQKPGLVNRNQFAWSLIRQGFRIGEKPNVEYIRKKVPDGLTDYFDMGANFTPSAEYADKQSSKTASQVLYHVTRTSSVPNIKAKGILLLQPTNWSEGRGGKRYGGGEIYAMDNLHDAVRWAAQMDWSFNQAMGSGKISIVVFDSGDAKWETDQNDPMSQAGAKGNWLKSDYPVKPKQIKKIVPVTIDMTRAVVQGKDVSLDGDVEADKESSTKSYGKGTPIGGTPNEYGAGDDPQNDEAENAGMDMQASEDNMAYKSQLLNKKALVDMHETPTMLPPRDDLKRHLDEVEQAAVMEGVKDVDAGPKKQQQIDPRVNPSGRAASGQTDRQAQKYLQSLGIVLKKIEGEYIVNFKGGAEATAYYTTDLKDAVGTAEAMVGAPQSKQADYDSDQDTRDEYFLDQVQDAKNEAKRHFMEEDYLQQQAVEDGVSMEQLWKEMGEEYTAEFYGYPYKRVQDFTDRPTR